MWKNILSLGVLVLASALFVHTLRPANAQLGPHISQGSNPIFSVGGYSNSIATETVSAQSGQSILITDVIISAQYNDSLEMVLTTSGGAEVGRFKAWNYQSYTGNGMINAQMVSGLMVPEGEELTVTMNGRGTYTFSGRYVAP
ncbi:MAG: hypothetical protein VX278_17365 [Myxococcota bacterium]|nr:hypothetical protein [Myxococcota bacterium]